MSILSLMSLVNIGLRRCNQKDNRRCNLAASGAEKKITLRCLLFIFGIGGSEGPLMFKLRVLAKIWAISVAFCCNFFGVAAV